MNFPERNAHEFKKNQLYLARSLQHIEQHIVVVDLGEYIQPFDDPEVERCAQIIRSYLEGPTITDSCGPDHQMRRIMSKRIRDNAPSEVTKWYETNRLRVNQWYGLQFLPQLFPNLFETIQPLHSLFQRLMQELQRYPEKDSNETGTLALEIASHVSMILHQLLTVLEKVDTQ
ncbi:hypothetical protein C5B42_02655 [Candidatus Cerribacteria bacterium 'Amazon FNV 2010 28 9']|uniref:Uncharacterized protein n=1 Tax=Candidatus Cerribacteria bacterium 'Amazon FNV 2010 28 9' TaxID=2081795 RepID=A0A317JQ88_9BACT|nr:MAG: hypothetical protein C5B42_02655 [Candidatus Cerribacteria bacterium 'Amazon FNV 2010 28 9']